MPQTHANITAIEIILSNHCKIIIDMYESVSFMRLKCGEKKYNYKIQSKRGVINMIYEQVKIGKIPVAI